MRSGSSDTIGESGSRSASSSSVISEAGIGNLAHKAASRRLPFAHRVSSHLPLSSPQGLLNGKMSSGVKCHYHFPQVLSARKPGSRRSRSPNDVSRFGVFDFNIAIAFPYGFSIRTAWMCPLAILPLYTNSVGYTANFSNTAGDRV